MCSIWPPHLQVSSCWTLPTCHLVSMTSQFFSIDFCHILPEYFSVCIPFKCPFVLWFWKIICVDSDGVNDATDSEGADGVNDAADEDGDSGKGWPQWWSWPCWGGGGNGSIHWICPKANSTTGNLSCRPDWNQYECHIRTEIVFWVSKQPKLSNATLQKYLLWIIATAPIQLRETHATHTIHATTKKHWSWSVQNNMMIYI